MLENILPDFVIRNIEFFIFVILMSAFLYYKRENLQINGKFPFLYMILYKTTWGIDLMKKWSKNQPRLWKTVAYCSVFIGIVGTILMIPFMIWQLYFIIDNDIETGGGVVLPLDTGSNLVFFVPFWYWIVIILFVAIVHEFGHGVIAKLYNVKVKSSGFAFAGLFLPILPAAFVEPDMKDLFTKKRWQQIAVLGAGPFANIFFSIIFIFMIIGLGMYAQNVYDDRGLYFQTVNESQTELYALNSSGVITEIIVDNKTINGSLNMISYFNENMTENDTIFFRVYDVNHTESDLVEIIPYKDNEGELRIGISGIQRDIVALYGKETHAKLIEIFDLWLFWFFLLNFGIGIMNLLPLWITDGGQITRIMLSKVMSEESAVIGVHIASLISLILIVFTISPSLLPF